MRCRHLQFHIHAFHIDQSRANCTIYRRHLNYATLYMYLTQFILLTLDLLAGSLTPTHCHSRPPASLLQINDHSTGLLEVIVITQYFGVVGVVVPVLDDMLNGAYVVMSLCQSYSSFTIRIK
jgi:hypothetical protein